MAETQGNNISKSFPALEVCKKMKLLKIKIQTLIKIFPAREWKYKLA